MDNGSFSTDVGDKHEGSSTAESNVEVEPMFTALNAIKSFSNDHTPSAVNIDEVDRVLDEDLISYPMMNLR